MRPNMRGSKFLEDQNQPFYILFIKDLIKAT
jgi:hypothetical protein